MIAQEREQTVEPGFLSILTIGCQIPRRNLESSGRRTTLANWITSPDIRSPPRHRESCWQYHLAASGGDSSDFGHSEKSEPSEC